jgi:hypothetical protein
MSNTQRPTAARKHTRTTKAKREDELNAGLKVILDGETYVVRQGDMTSRIERELRREYGGSFESLKRELGNDPGSDSIATFIWLARRVAGEHVTLDDVEVSYADILDGDLDVDLAGKPEESDSPEA